MKVRFICDNGANTYSVRKSNWIDVKELGYSDEEWSELSDFNKYTEAEAWANQYIEISWEENE